MSNTMELLIFLSPLFVTILFSILAFILPYEKRYYPSAFLLAASTLLLLMVLLVPHLSPLILGALFFGSTFLLGACITFIAGALHCSDEDEENEHHL